MNDENQEFLDENSNEYINEESNNNGSNDQTVADTPDPNQELAELKDRNLRLFAEFENFRKRTIKEKLELSKYANESLLLDMLPVLDDFDRALKQIESSEDKNMLQGVELIHSKLVKTLENKGLKKLEIQPGDDFDLEQQEAITQIETPEEHLKGKIVDVVETGYSLNDKVIRFAKVVVGK